MFPHCSGVGRILYLAGCCPCISGGCPVNLAVSRLIRSKASRITAINHTTPPGPNAQTPHQCSTYNSAKIEILSSGHFYSVQWYTGLQCSMLSPFVTLFRDDTLFNKVTKSVTLCCVVPLVVVVYFVTLLFSILCYCSLAVCCPPGGGGKPLIVVVVTKAGAPGQSTLSVFSSPTQPLSISQVFPIFR